MQRKTPRYLKVLQAVAVALWLTWGFSVVWSIELLSPSSSIGVSNGCAIFTWSWPARLNRFVPDDYILSRSDYLPTSIWPRFLPGELVPSTGRMTWPVLIIPIWTLAVPLTFAVIYLRRRRPVLDDSPRCDPCGFILTGNESGVCPECGRRSDSRGTKKCRVDDPTYAWKLTFRLVSRQTFCRVIQSLHTHESCTL